MATNHEAQRLNPCSSILRPITKITRQNSYHDENIDTTKVENENDDKNQRKTSRIINCKCKSSVPIHIQAFLHLIPINKRARPKTISS